MAGFITDSLGEVGVSLSRFLADAAEQSAVRAANLASKSADLAATKAAQAAKNVATKDVENIGVKEARSLASRAEKQEARSLLNKVLLPKKKNLHTKAKQAVNEGKANIKKKLKNPVQSAQELFSKPPEADLVKKVPVEEKGFLKNNTFNFNLGGGGNNNGSNKDPYTQLKDPTPLDTTLSSPLDMTVPTPLDPSVAQTAAGDNQPVVSGIDYNQLPKSVTALENVANVTKKVSQFASFADPLSIPSTIDSRLRRNLTRYHNWYNQFKYRKQGGPPPDPNQYVTYVPAQTQ